MGVWELRPRSDDAVISAFQEPRYQWLFEPRWAQAVVFFST